MRTFKLAGFGFFYQSKDMARDPEESAARALAAGSTWAAVLVQSVDGRKQSPARVKAHCDALRAVDIRPCLYIFPTPSVLVQAAAHAAECAEAADCWDLCLDLEPYGGEDWVEATILRLALRCADAGFSIVFSVFTRPEWKRIAWGEILPNVTVLLQVYKRAHSAKALAAAVLLWPDRTVVVCFATYEGDVELLRADMKNCAPYAVQAGAAAAWALGTTDAEEAAAIKEWALATWAPR